MGYFCIAFAKIKSEQFLEAILKVKIHTFENLFLDTIDYHCRAPTQQLFGKKN